MDEMLFSPPPMSASGDGLSPAGEGIEVVLRDGRRITGKFVVFDSFRNSIEVSLEVRDKKANVFFRLEDVKSIQLLKPRERRFDSTPDGNDASGLSQNTGCLEFRVAFQDGEHISGETFGFRVNTLGLCLYPVRDGEFYTCLFVPHGAMASHEVGPRIGEVLVGERLVSQDQLDDFLSLQQQERGRPLGDYLSSRMLVSVDEVEKALDLQKSFPNLKLGEILISENLITEQQLANALEEQKRNREKPLGEILVDAGVLSKKDIQVGLAKKLGIPFVDLRKFPVTPSLFTALPEGVARKHQVLPLFERDNRLAVAMTDPLDYRLLEILQFHTGKIIEPVFAQEEDLARAIDLAYAGVGLSEILSEDHLWEEEDEVPAYISEQEMDGVGGVIIKLVNKLITDAYLDKVSDIHIEPRPGKEKTLVRFRRDGVLRTYHEVPAELRRALIARIKVMADLDTSVRRKPQDGKISFGKFSPIKIDLRVATLPTAGGQEDVVLRILGANRPMPIQQLGLSRRDRAAVERIVGKPHGLFLVCGPTGSGKTTSLHSLLGTLNTPERKIWTAEDPVEITQPGLRQVQINPKSGVTFATTMRSFLRADPDIIMVGEMRDAETARIGIEAH